MSPLPVLSGREVVQVFVSLGLQEGYFDNTLAVADALRQLASAPDGLLGISAVLSQCNSFLILRIVNPNDQKYVRQVVESLGEDDAGLLPDLSTGDALLSGQFVRFPVVVHVEKGRAEGRYEEEDFLAKPGMWSAE
jgi:hypothetical protein